MAIVTHISLKLLIRAGILLRVRSYEETAKLALGRWGEIAVLAGQFFFDYGAALSYLIITGDTASEVMEYLLGGNFTGLRQLCILALACGGMLPPAVHASGHREAREV